MTRPTLCGLTEVDTAPAVAFFQGMLLDQTSASTQLPIMVALDTGAAVNLVTEEVAARVNAITTEGPRVRLAGIGGGVEISQRAELRLCIAEALYNVTALVVPSLPGQLRLLLSFPYMLAHRFSIICDEQGQPFLTTPSGRERVPLLQHSPVNGTNSQADPIALAVLESVVIPPRQEALVQAGPAVAPAQPWPVLLTNAEGFVGPFLPAEPHSIADIDASFLVARGITKLQGGRTPVLLLNMSDEALTLPQGFPVAVFQPAVLEHRRNCVEEEVGHASRPQIHSSLELAPEDGVGLSPEQRLQLTSLLEEFRDIFVNAEEAKKELPAARVPPYHLELTEPTHPHRVSRGAMARWSPTERDEVQREVQRLVRLNILEMSSSPWAARLAPVRKPTGALRLVVDYRNLNKVLREDHWPAPSPAHILQDITRMAPRPRYFSSLDVADAFLRIPLAPSSRPLTAFRAPQGVYHWTRVPFGLSVSPAAWQRTIDLLLSNIPRAVPFVDDLLAVSEHWNQHLVTLRQIFMALRRAGLQLRREKCAFARDKVTYLGMIISQEGVSPDPSKTTAIRDFPTPRNIKELRSFLGLANFVRRWVRHFSIRAAPLQALLRKDVEWQWTEVEVNAFNDLRCALEREVILSHPDFSAQGPAFELSVDSAKVGCGAILSQASRPVAYFSRAFTPQQGALAAGELELFGIVLAVEHFRPYLWGRRRTTIFCDHKNIAALLRKPPNDKIQRWASRLSGFDLEFRYNPGPKQVAADALSRAPVLATTRSMAASSQQQPVPRVPASTERKSSETATTQPLVDQGEHVQQQAPSHIQQVPVEHDGQLALREAQARDPLVRALVALISNDAALLESMKHDAEEHIATARSLAARYTFRLEEGILVRVANISGENTPRSQVVVPDVDDMRAQVFCLIHDRLAHRGFKKCVRVLSERAWWPSAHTDLKKYIASCDVCQKQRPRDINAGIMQHLPLVEEPFSFICIDFVGPLPATQRGNLYALVFLDLASRWVNAIATPNMTAEVVQEALLVWMADHGVPHHIHSDNGASFIADGVRLAYERLGVQRSLTTPYRPQADPAECAVKAVVRTLRALLLDDTLPFQSRDWDIRLPVALFAIRATVSDATGTTPFKYIYGREMRLPLDLILGRTPRTPPVTTLQELPERLHSLRLRALEFNERQRDRSKHIYDRQHYHRAFELGAEVLVYNMHPLGKFEPRWEGPFIVHRVYDNKVTYLVGDPYNIDNRLVHVSRLTPYFRRLHGEPKPVQTQHHQQTDREQHLEDGERWVIRQLIGRRTTRGQKQYLVEWEAAGYAPTWEPANELPDDYKQAYDEYF
jgi:transposase InsO family protein